MSKIIFKCDICGKWYSCDVKCAPLHLHRYTNYNICSCNSCMPATMCKSCKRLTTKEVVAYNL